MAQTTEAHKESVSRVHSDLSPTLPSSSLEQVYIAVMGVTGSGKSQFISQCTSSPIVQIGHGIKSCTKDVDEHTFVYRNKHIHLIDTPGFNDTYLTDREVLDEIARWLGTAYLSDVKLTGILYLHKITETKVQGTTLGDLRMFKKLCGEDYYPRVHLATSFWDTERKANAERREAELIAEDDFWGRMVIGGSKTHRHYGSKDSAMGILNYVLNYRKKETVPEFVQVRRTRASMKPARVRKLTEGSWKNVSFTRSSCSR